jgi:tRNA(His) 5'-end guanylyltransferase
LDQGRIDYSKPFTQQEVKTARQLIGSQNTDPQLTYTELDQVKMLV